MSDVGQSEEGKVSYMVQPDLDIPGSALVTKYVNGEAVHSYTIDEGVCSCPGFFYRGRCRHIDYMVGSVDHDEKFPRRRALEEAGSVSDWLSEEFGNNFGLIGDLADGKSEVRSVHFVVKVEDGVGRYVSTTDNGLPLIVDFVDTQDMSIPWRSITIDLAGDGGSHDE